MTNENVYQTPSSNLGVGSEEERNYAGFWVRVGASIIDTILIILITAPFLYLIYGKAFWQTEGFTNGALNILISYVFPAIAVILFWLYKSATPGKMIFGLKIISLGKSTNLSVMQSIGRYLAYYPSMLIFMLGIIWVAFDKKKQGWHDKLANTAVIKDR